MKDLSLISNPVSSLRHAAQAAAANGTGVDLAGYEGALCVLDQVAIGGTGSPTVTHKLQESDDNSTFTDVATADMVGGAQPAAQSAVGVIVRSYIGAKRYVRWALTALTGTSPTSTASGTVIRGMARHNPAGQTQQP